MNAVALISGNEGKSLTKSATCLQISVLSLLTGVSAAFNLICSLHMWLKVFLNIMTDPIVEVSPYCAQRRILPTKYQILANPQPPRQLWI